MSLLLARAEVGRRIVDVRVRADRISEVADKLRPGRDEDVIDARGGALLPGLHDHHVHLLAMAAAAASVPCGPPAVTGTAGLRAALRSAAARLPAGTWLRGTGYHESVAGELDRWTLDHLLPERPVRIQQRGGALWILNSLAMRELRLARDGDIAPVDDPDVERDETGEPTGRLWRYDSRLREAVGPAAGTEPDLGGVGAVLTRHGITGVTDATPGLDERGLRLLGTALAEGRLPPRVQLLGAGAGAALPAGLTAGPYKLLLRDHDLPSLDELAADIASAHRADRPVAVHCVTRESLLLTLTALEQLGPLPGDRIEHAAVVPVGIAEWMARLALRVVTQPGFVHSRGDQYLADVPEHDRELLYPYASLCEADVPVAPSSDAPFGDLDPWRAMATAATRHTRAGTVLGPHERMPAARVLAGYLSDLDDPGGAPRRVVPDAPAELCLLHLPLERALADPRPEHVRLVTHGDRVAMPG